MDTLIRPHFRSIIALLSNFQGLRGLQLKHFRYALISDHDNVDFYDIPAIKKQIPPEKLEELIASGDVVLDSMRHAMKIVQRLNELVVMGVIIRDTRFKVPRYRLKTGFIYITNKNYHIKNLQETKIGFCNTFPDDRIILYNMHFKDFQNMSDEHQTEIRNYVQHINQLILKIEDIYKPYILQGKTHVSKVSFNGLGLTRL